MDEDLGLSTVLPVATDHVAEYELELPPANGLDYLRRVRSEAKSCPATVTVELELPIQEEKSCSNVRQLSRSSAIIGHSHAPLCSPAPAGYVPSLEWQQKQVSAFSDVRMKLSQEIQQRKKDKSITPFKLPKASNMEGWCKLCFGRFHSKIKSVEEVEGLENSETVEDEVNQSDESSSNSTPPLLSIISGIGSDNLPVILEYHINWFEATGFTAHQGRWFYALLAALEKPLLPESCSLIRNLARICSNLRASLESVEDPLLPHLNLLICLVSRYFDQTDLADDHPGGAS